MGGFDPWACSTRRMICASAVSAPTLVALKVNEPLPLTVAPMTSSPSSLLTGMGSPVSIDSSTVEEPLDDDPVDGDLLARAHAHEVAVAHLGDRHVGLDAVADDARRARLQADELLDRLAGLALGARLEHAPQEDQGDDQGGRVEVARHAEALVHEGGGEEDPERAVDVGRRGAHDDERVHVRGAVAQRRPGALVELPADPELHRRRQGPEHPAVLQPGGHEAELHAAEEDEHGEDGAHDDLAAQGEVGAPARELLVVDERGRVCRRGRDVLVDLVAGSRDGAHELLVRHLAGDVLDRRLLGGQVDLGLQHAGHAGERLLVARHAARAGHAADLQDVGLRGHAVADLLDRLAQVLEVDQRGVVGDRRPLGGEVHVGLAHALDLAQRLLVARHAGRAGHARDGDLDCRCVAVHRLVVGAPLASLSVSQRLALSIPLTGMKAERLTPIFRERNERSRDAAGSAWRLVAGAPQRAVGDEQGAARVSMPRAEGTKMMRTSWPGGPSWSTTHAPTRTYATTSSCRPASTATASSSTAAARASRATPWARCGCRPSVSGERRRSER